MLFPYCLKNLGAYITFFALGDCHVTLPSAAFLLRKARSTSQVLLSVGTHSSKAHDKLNTDETSNTRILCNILAPLPPSASA